MNPPNKCQVKIMKHHQYKPDFKFVKDPIDFNKYTDKEILQYCLGATLYMPGTKDIISSLKNGKLIGLTSMVMCFEDAISEDELPLAETNVSHILDVISSEIDSGNIDPNRIPLFFLRVRNPTQFEEFSKKLTRNQVKLITGFVFPKFTAKTGNRYLNHLKSLNEDYNEILYGMPILESREIGFIETRSFELIGLKNILLPYKDLILNIRVGATDFSSLFGVRRGVDYSVYDILIIRDCLSDILNFLNREGCDYVISAPVWEYFLVNKKRKFEISIKSVFSSLLKRNLIVNEAIDGLLREVVLDKANGFVGKTIIHPSHLKYVNSMQAITREEYDDATQILAANGGVIKSLKENKMNEIAPHRSWAKRIISKSKAYGVIENTDYFKLFS